MKRRSLEHLTSEDEPTRAFARYLHEGSAFRRLDTLAGFVTMGCNIPLFTFTFGPERIIPITKARLPTEQPAFPGAVLTPEVKAEARWLNYYSRHDLLGYPLKPLSSHYMAEERLQDIEVMSEGRLLHALASLPWLSPLACKAAHTNYWTNGRVSRGAADLIARIATAGDPASTSRFPAIFSRRGVKPAATVPASADTEPLTTA
jgi:hypothetical protein